VLFCHKFKSSLSVPAQSAVLILLVIAPVCYAMVNYRYKHHGVCIYS